MSIQEVLAHFRRIARSFDDSQALEAVTKVRETFESEQKGVIYERRSPTPEIQLVIEDLTKRVDSLRRGEDGSREAVKLSEIIVCLQFLEKERQTRGFESKAQAQRFLSVHGSIQTLFQVGRHLLRSKYHRLLRERAFTCWNEVTCACLKTRQTGQTVT